MDNYGIISLIPVIIVVVTAFISKRTTEPMLLGGIIGFIILAGKGFFPAALDAMYAVLTASNTMWIVMMFMFFGGMIEMFERTGSTLGFGNVATKIAKGRKSTLVTTWILGIIVFADDYLNALAVGVAMRNLTDKYKVSRTFLSFIVACTGASVCCILPFATWAAYMMGLMGETGVMGADLYSEYIKTIPFLIYAWVSFLLAFLYALGLFPMVGPVRKDEQRAAETGITLPASIAEVQEKKDDLAATAKEVKNTIALTFLIPIIVLAIVAVVTGDVLVGVIAGFVLTIIMVAAQRLMSGTDICIACEEGAKSMLPGALIVISAFFLQEANNGLGLTEFVIESTESILSPALFPFIVFVFMSLLAFGSGSFWGMAAIAFPIILPLAAALDVNLYLASGALISATVFGSQACFFSDCATIVCMATQIKNADYAKSVLPMFFVPFGISAVIFLVLGFIF